MNAIAKFEPESLFKELESAIGIQEGFFKDLIKNKNDWSFVIGLHAFLEAAMTILIVKALGKEDIHGIIARLPIGHSNNGKIAFIKKLSLLSDNAIKFIQTLSEIRNNCVHDIKHLKLNLEEYYSHLDESSKKRFVDYIGYNLKDEITIQKNQIKKADFIRENPRFSIEFDAFYVIWEIALKLGAVTLKHRENELNKKAAELFYSFYAYLGPTK